LQGKHQGGTARPSLKSSEEVAARETVAGRKKPGQKRRRSAFTERFKQGSTPAIWDPDWEKEFEACLRGKKHQRRITPWGKGAGMDSKEEM